MLAGIGRFAFNWNSLIFLTKTIYFKAVWENDRPDSDLIYSGVIPLQSYTNIDKSEYEVMTLTLRPVMLV